MPTYKVTDPKTGRVMRLTGDSPPTQSELEQIFSQFEVQKDRTFGEKVGGAFDAAAAMATGAIAQPVSGLVGLANLALHQDPERAANRVEQLQSSLTYGAGEAGQEYMQNIANAPVIKQIGETMERGSQQLGDVVYDVTGSPAAASIAKAAPEAAAAYLGAKVPSGAATALERKATQSKVDGQRDIATATAAINQQAPKAGPTSSAIKTLSEQEIRDVADVDPDFFAALQEIGVTAPPLTSYASKNPQYRAIEQGLAAMAGSPLKNAEYAFGKNLSESAANLLREYGALDTGAASVKWREKASDTVKALEDEATAAYGELGSKVDQRQPANPVKSLEFISERTDDLPLGIADESAPLALKNAFRQLQSRRRTNPETGEIEIVPANYASMDTLRKQIGAAAFKREGEFKDADSALLKGLYGSLTDDLNAMAESQGLVDEVKQAKAVVTKRKVLEDQMQTLLGDKLQKDLEPVVMGSIKDLAKGGMQKYRNIMDAIPDKADRAELLMTALSNSFSKTRAGEKGTFTNSDYLSWYNDTMAKPAIRKVLERDLPEGAAQKLDALAKVSEGIARATSSKVQTGAVLSLLDDRAGFIQRMMGATLKNTAGRVPSPTGEAARTIGSFLQTDNKNAGAVADLLSSPQFMYVIQRGVSEGVVTGKKTSEALAKAEKRLAQSDKYKKWARTLSANEQRKLESLGVTQFLMASQQDQKTKQQAER